MRTGPSLRHGQALKLPWWTISSEEHPLALAARIASNFDLPTPMEAYEFPDKGNINQHTFVILSGTRGSPKEYLLQKINQQVFTRPRSVMAAMIACIETQNRSIAKGLVPPGQEWEAITLLPTRCGKPYLDQEDRRDTGCWRMMVKIADCMTFKSLSEISNRAQRLRLAEEAGKGLALYGDFTSKMETGGLENPLPGYRDTRNYYSQLKSVLAGNRTLEDASPFLPENPILRQSTEQHFLLHLSEKEYQRRMNDPVLKPFIRFTLEQEAFGLTLLEAMESGRIRTVAIHGDTKLDNFLFSRRTEKVKALVDLDTIMPHTWLADWGDMVRSLSNVAGEKEPDLDRIQVDMDIYRALACGFLSTAREVTAKEVVLMDNAVEIIALELGVRFLSDYLRGDSYFKLGPADPPELNKIRAMVQLTLVHRLRENSNTIRRCLQEARTGA